MNKSSESDVTKKNRFQYDLTLEGTGGEMVMGTVTGGFVSYWSSQPRRQFSEYVFSSDNERPRVIEEATMECPWHENDNVGHANGPYVNVMKLTVVDTNLDKVVCQLKGSAMLNAVQIDTGTDVRSKHVRKSADVIKLQSSQDHELRYTISSDQPFDASRLSIIEDKVDGLSFLGGVSYNDNELEWDRWETECKGHSVLLLPKKKAA